MFNSRITVVENVQYPWWCTENSTNQSHQNQNAPKELFNSADFHEGLRIKLVSLHFQNTWIFVYTVRRENWRNW